MNAGRSVGFGRIVQDLQKLTMKNALTRNTILRGTNG